MLSNTNETAQKNISEQVVNTHRLYNLLFNGKITLSEYYKALGVLKDNTSNS